MLCLSVFECLSVLVCLFVLAAADAGLAGLAGMAVGALAVAGAVVAAGDWAKLDIEAVPSRMAARRVLVEVMMCLCRKQPVEAPGLLSRSALRRPC